MVWFNSLVAVRRRHDRRRARKVDARRRRDQVAAQIMSKLAHSPAADPSLASQHEDETRLAFEAGNAVLRGQLPVRLSERQGRTRRKIFKNIALGAVPGRRDRPAGARRRSAASTGASARTPSTRTRPSRPPRACATRRTRGRPRSRAACRRRSRASTRPGAQQGLSVRRPDPQAARRPRAVRPVRRRPTRTCRWPIAKARLAADSTSRPTASSTTLRGQAQGRPELEGRCYERDRRREPAAARRAQRRRRPRPTARKAERKLGLDAVRAGRDRDARGHGVSDHLRVLPVAAARRPALPGRPQAGSASTTTSRVLSSSLWWSDVWHTVLITVVSVVDRARRSACCSRW